MNNEMLKEILAMPYVWIGVGAFVILVVLILMVKGGLKSQEHFIIIL